MEPHIALPTEQVSYREKKSLEENQHSRRRRGPEKKHSERKEKNGNEISRGGKRWAVASNAAEIKVRSKSGASSHSLMVPEPLPKKAVLSVIRCTLPLLP